MTFEETARRAMRDFIKDFPLDAQSAAAIVGNFGHETGGFTKLQEIKPVVAGSRGGYGWAQWTGPRRRQYEAWCSRKMLDPSSYDANYGYAKYELQNEYARAISAVKAAKRTDPNKDNALYNKVIAFEVAYEGAGVKAYDSRTKWAQRALNAFGAPPPPPDIPKPKPAPQPAPSWIGALIAALARIFSRGK